MHFFATVRPEDVLQHGKTSYAEATARIEALLPAGDVGSVVH
jgi:hypothetical protein